MLKLHRSAIRQIPGNQGLFRRKSNMADTTLLVHGSSLLLCGKSGETQINGEESLAAEELALAARRLLPVAKQNECLCLCLPASEFIATPLKLPALDEDKLYSAVRLQLPGILPGNTEDLLPALHVSKNSPAGVERTVLWYPTVRADELFQAFQRHGLFLGCILPRPLLALEADKQVLQCIIDSDEQHYTYAEYQNGELRRWLSIPQTEYVQEAFRTQFNDRIKALEGTDAGVLHKAGLDDWRNNASQPLAAISSYCFVPPGAQSLVKSRRNTQKQKVFKWLGTAVAVISLLGIGGMEYRFKQKRAKLADIKAQTADIIQLREEIFTLEEETAPVREFPRQNVVALLQHLNQVIPKDSWISAFKVGEDGLMEVEGHSPNPTAILETLTANPQFAGVAFSRTTQGQRFGIQFRMAEVDIADYIKKYFPTD